MGGGHWRPEQDYVSQQSAPVNVASVLRVDVADDLVDLNKAHTIPRLWQTAVFATEGKRVIYLRVEELDDVFAQNEVPRWFTDKLQLVHDAY